jgi:adenosylhomocysteine nucleosidase
VLYALPDEVRFCGASLQPDRQLTKRADLVEPHDLNNSCSTAALARMYRIGVGSRSATQNTERLLIQNPATRAVIVVGYAGGLANGLEPGSVVIADSVSTPGSDHSMSPDRGLLALAAEVRPPGFHSIIGALITADRVLIRAAEKEQFARSTRAVAVDMESAGAAAVATEYGVPWLAVRVITDGVNDDLPLDFNALANPDGSVNRSRIVAETLLHPWKIPALIQLGSRSTLASRALAAFLRQFLPLIATLSP